jgi:hypothetical protein
MYPFLNPRQFQSMYRPLRLPLFPQQPQAQQQAPQQPQGGGGGGSGGLDLQNLQKFFNRFGGGAPPASTIDAGGFAAPATTPTAGPAAGPAAGESFALGMPGAGAGALEAPAVAAGGAGAAGGGAGAAAGAAEGLGAGAAGAAEGLGAGAAGAAEGLGAGAAAAAEGIGAGVAGAAEGIGGGIMALLGLLFSDPRLKENKSRVGELYDGTPVWGYNYIGDPTPRIGLMANEVAERYPQAVHDVGGLSTVDYGRATQKSRAMGILGLGEE